MFCRTFSVINRKLCISSTNVSTVRNMSESAVGFIGLGSMGSHMAHHLLQKGHRLVVYDVSQKAMAALTAKGAVKAESPADLATKCDRILSMVPTSAHVMQVYAGENGVLSQVKAGTYLLDSSTIDPQTSRQLSDLAKEKSATFLDTPVTGAVPAARDGKLTFLVGGTDSEVAAIRDLLLCMGKNVVHCGPIGTGEAAKIVNNMLLAVNMIGTSEALNMAKKLGIDPKLMTQILNISSGRSWTSEIYNPVPGVMENVPSTNNYEGGFKAQLMTKDLGLAQAEATRANCPTPMGTLSHQIFRLMINNGYGTKDMSVVYKFLQEFDEKN